MLGADGNRVFLDSNIVLYLLSGDGCKTNCVEALLDQRQAPVISVQVLNEVAHVGVRKLKMPWDELGQFLDLIRRFCKVVALTEDVHDRARYIAQRYQLSFYDACIVAAAIVAGCATLYTEDLGYGQIIEGSLRISNPFLNAMR